MSSPKEIEVSKKHAVFLSLGGAFIAGLCCFSPVVIVLLGLGSAAFAGSLATDLYEQYKWYFRASGLLFLAIAFYIWYFKKSQSCSIDQKKRLQHRMFNLFLISVFVFVVAYLIWTYVIVDYIGAALKLWPY